MNKLKGIMEWFYNREIYFENHKVSLFQRPKFFESSEFSIMTEDLENEKISKKRIIGLSGKIGSGKNYIAEKVLYNKLKKMGKNVVIMAFGDYLKMTCYTKDGISYEKLFHTKDKETRIKLQERGTDERKIDEKIFIKMFECNMKIAFDRNIDVVIVSDMRLHNEFEFLRSKDATLVRINSLERTLNKMNEECLGNEDDIKKVSNHISEIALDNRKDFDYYINNDYGEDINSIIDEILRV